MSDLALSRGATGSLAERWRRFFAGTGGRILARIGILAILLAAWQYLPGPGMRFWASDPRAIVMALAGWIIDGTLWRQLFATLTVMSTSYVLGCVIGVGLGLAFGLLPRLDKVMSPFIFAAYSLPKIALAPLLIILFGIGFASKIVLVTLVVFFLVFSSTIDGVHDTDTDLLQSLRLMGATRSELIRKVLIPSALPWIFTSMRIAVRYAFSNTLLAELIASNAGIGYLIAYHSGIYDAAGTYAAVLVLVILSVALTEVLTRVERLMSRWRQ
jgi:NitT/TauT family transport system permease protein